MARMKSARYVQARLVKPQRHVRRHAGLGVVLHKLDVEGLNPFDTFASHNDLARPTSSQSKFAKLQSAPR